MIGYDTVLRIRRLELEIDQLGFRWGNSKLGGAWGAGEIGTVALMPKDDALPIYNRDAELFVGSIEQLEVWLQGFRTAREYDWLLMGEKINTQRKRKEQDVRNRDLMKTIKSASLKKEEA